MSIQEYTDKCSSSRSVFHLIEGLVTEGDGFALFKGSKYPYVRRFQSKKLGRKFHVYRRASGNERKTIRKDVLTGKFYLNVKICQCDDTDRNTDPVLCQTPSEKACGITRPCNVMKSRCQRDHFSRRIRRIVCKFCDRYVSLKKNRISHRCGGRTRINDVKNKPIGEFRMVHLDKRISFIREECLRHRMESDIFVKWGNCSNCHKHFSGREKYALGRRTLQVISTPRSNSEVEETTSYIDERELVRSCAEKDIDEEERVRYIEKDMLDGVCYDGDDRRRILRIRMDNLGCSSDLMTYKYFF